MWKSPRRALTAIAILTAIGCGGDDDGNGPTGSISLTASPPALTLPQGGSGTVTVTLVRGGGFADPVNVAVTGLPAGVTLSVTPAQLTGATTQATVTVNVGNTVPAGTYTATVTATATGIGSATATYTLTVTATPNYALTATPAAVTAGQGGSGTTTIGIQRTNFTGTPVTLTLDNPPPGITGTFSPTPATGDQSVLTINVAGTVAQGPYNLTVKGSATGPGDKTTTVALTVGPPPSYTLSASPATVSIPAGATGETTVNIARTSFPGAVTLSLDAPPQGMTATFNPAAPTTNTSTATISVPANATPGNYNVTIKGTATGLTDRTTTVAVTVTAAATFTISATPATLSMAAGGNNNTSVAIVRTNFTTDVALSVASVSPTNAGITGVFTPALLTGANLTANLVISAAASVTPGNYTVTVQGVGGSLTRTATVTVTVTGAASVTLSMSPATLTIQQGGSSTATLNAVRTNYTGNITPTFTSNPAGPTLTFNPNPITTGNSAQVTVNVGASVPVGTYNVTITGASGAAGNPTTTLAVTVTAPTGGSNFEWDFCTVDGVPLKFWRLSGTTWAEVAPTVVGNVTRFAFNISTTSGGVAFTIQSSAFSLQNSTRISHQRAKLREATKAAREKMRSARLQLANQVLPLDPTYFDTQVLFGLASELSGYRETCVTTSTAVSKTFNVSGMGASESGVLGYGGATASLSSATPSYNLMVPPGSYDWLAAFGPTPTFPDLTSTFTAYRIGRNEAAPGAAVNVNRVGATAFTTFPFTVSGGTGGSFWLYSQGLQGSRGFIVGLPIGSLLSNTNTGTMLFLAPADRVGSDLWSLDITNLAQSGTTSDLRSSVNYIGSAPPASGNFSLPPAVPAFTVSSVMGASVPWSVTGQTPTEYQTAASAVVAGFEGGDGNALVTMVATRGWQTANGMTTSYTLTGPTLPGFQAAWAPAGPLASSSVIMFGFNVNAAPAPGTVAAFAARTQM